MRRRPVGDQAVGRHDAAARDARVADADLGARVAADQVHAGTRFESELHTDGTIPPVREIVIVISDLYLPRDADEALAAAGALARPARARRSCALRHAHAGARTAAGARGWPRWLGRADLAAVAPAAQRGRRRQRRCARTPTLWLATPGAPGRGPDERAPRPPQRSCASSDAELAPLAADFRARSATRGSRCTRSASGELLLRTPGRCRATHGRAGRAWLAGLAESLPRGTGATAAALRRLGARSRCGCTRIPSTRPRARGERP